MEGEEYIGNIKWGDKILLTIFVLHGLGEDVGKMIELRLTGFLDGHRLST